MRPFDAKSRKPKRKKRRFQRPEFQSKLARARKFVRSPKERPSQISSKILYSFGFRSRFTRTMAVMFLIAVVYYLTISSKFLVTEAVIEGNAVTQTQVEDVLFRLQKSRVALIPKNHILLLNKDSFLKALRLEMPNVRSLISYRRVLLNKIRTEVEIREAKYVWQTGPEYYFIDQDGIVFQRLLNYDPIVLSQPLVKDKTGASVAVGEELNIKKALAFLRGLEENWTKHIQGVEYTGATLPGRASIDMSITTNLGFDVVFDLNRGVKGQLENLNLLLTREIKPETFAGLSYIDLRLANVGYYCYKDAECANESSLEEQETIQPRS